MKKCKTDGKSMKECIKEERVKQKEKEKSKPKAKAKVDDFKGNLFKDCMTDCIAKGTDKKECFTTCTTDSGADPKEKGKLKLKYEKESIKGDIDTCIAGGTSKKLCLKNQFKNSSAKDKKKVKDAIKSSLYD